MKRLRDFVNKHQSPIQILWAVAIWALFGVVYFGLMRDQPLLVNIGMGAMVFLMASVLVLL